MLVRIHSRQAELEKFLHEYVYEAKYADEHIYDILRIYQGIDLAEKKRYLNNMQAALLEQQKAIIKSGASIVRRDLKPKLWSPPQSASDSKKLIELSIQLQKIDEQLERLGKLQRMLTPTARVNLHHDPNNIVTKYLRPR